MLFVVSKLLNLSVKCIFLKFESLGLFTEDLATNLIFQTKHCLLEENQQAARAVKLVDKLVSLLKELGRDDIFNVLCCVFSSRFQVCDLLVLDVEQLHVVFLLLCKHVASTIELLLSIGDNLAGKVLDGVVEVLDGEDDTWSRS